MTSSLRIGATVLIANDAVIRSHQFSLHRRVASARVVIGTLARWETDELTIIVLTRHSAPAELVLAGVAAWVSASAGTPMLVGGGINSKEVAVECIGRGADRILLGQFFWDRPQLAAECADQLGVQSVVVALPVVLDGDRLLRWDTRLHRPVPISGDALGEIKSGAVSEVLVQDVRCDGADGSEQKDDIFERVSTTIMTPMIASGGMSVPSRAARAARCPAVAALSVGNVNLARELALDPIRRAARAEGRRVRGDV